MHKTQLDEAIAYASERGLYLHDGIIRKQVDGVWGMYATKPIDQHAVIVSYPKNKVLRPIKSAYPDHMPDDTRYCHTAAKAYLKGRDSEYWGIFLSLDSLASLQSVSTYFMTEAELSQIDGMSRLLGARVREFNEMIRAQVSTIRAFDASLPEDVLTMICLNNQNRTWRDSGFVPVMDLFNHSDRWGRTREASKKAFLIKAGKAYQPGDEVFLSYSQKDMYLHAINYNYFDPKGTHFIHFGYRFIQTATSPFEKALAEICAERHQMKLEKRGLKLLYRITDPAAVISEEGPSEALTRYLQDNASSSIESLRKRIYDASDLDRHFKAAIRSLQSCIHIDHIVPDTLPDKLKRFYFMLQKEKVMLERLDP